jgi:DNA-binding transcriptional LysR family regulator
VDQVAALILFIRTLDLGSISAAARSLDLSPAVASQRLKKLEEQLGVRLLHRTTRQLRPTPEGRALLEKARGLVEDLDTITSNLREAGTEVTGTLRVTMSSTFGRLYISPLLPEFLAAHPALKLHVDFSDQWLDLVNAGFDLAIRIGVLRDSNLVARKVGNDARILCASPEYLRRRGPPHSLEDLTEHDCLLMAARNAEKDVWRLYDSAGHSHAVRVKGKLESNQGELLKYAALAGLGIAIHSTWHVRDELRSGRLQQVLPGYSLESSGIYAVMPQRHLVPRRVHAFAEFISERLAQAGF